MQNIFTKPQKTYIIISVRKVRNELINDINNYISYLNSKGLFVTVHGKGISGLLEHNVHSNPFCALVKTDTSAWQKCVVCQQKVFKEYEKGSLFGMCYAGMEEYVFFVNDKTFVSVSGYGIDKERATRRINRISQEFYLESSELLKVYENSLKHKSENIEELNAVIKPLCNMLYLLQLFIADVPETATKSKMFDSILEYAQRNFMQNITVRDIAQACSCSQSTVCHLFKQYMGISAKKYVANLRIDQAKKLLATSDLPISEVALMCGFSNINYFPTAFKKSVGINPTDYRNTM